MRPMPGTTRGIRPLTARRVGPGTPRGCSGRRGLERAPDRGRRPEHFIVLEAAGAFDTVNASSPKYSLKVFAESIRRKYSRRVRQNKIVESCMQWPWRDGYMRQYRTAPRPGLPGCLVAGMAILIARGP
jgi:hypothetical protein